MICALCLKLISDPALSEKEQNDKLISHVKWNHPTAKDIEECRENIELLTFTFQRAERQGDLIAASMKLAELSSEALRYKKYIDKKLVEE